MIFMISQILISKVRTVDFIDFRISLILKDLRSFKNFVNLRRRLLNYYGINGIKKITPNQRSKLCILRETWERYHIPDVTHAGNKLHQPLKA
jgi:hypothetical protein